MYTFTLKDFNFVLLPCCVTLEMFSVWALQCESIKKHLVLSEQSKRIEALHQPGLLKGKKPISHRKIKEQVHLYKATMYHQSTRSLRTWPPWQRSGEDALPWLFHFPALAQHTDTHPPRENTQVLPNSREDTGWATRPRASKTDSDFASKQCLSFMLFSPRWHSPVAQVNDTGYIAW